MVKAPEKFQLYPHYDHRVIMSELTSTGQRTFEVTSTSQRSFEVTSTGQRSFEIKLYMYKVKGHSVYIWGGSPEGLFK
jgi:hypothetical protein